MQTSTSHYRVFNKENIFWRISRRKHPWPHEYSEQNTFPPLDRVHSGLKITFHVWLFGEEENFAGISSGHLSVVWNQFRLLRKSENKQNSSGIRSNNNLAGDLSQRNPLAGAVN